MDRENGKGILFGVLGIMTLIIAILGASLAYFSATAKSRENAVTVKSATVTVTYVDGQVLNATNLIPATQTVAETAYLRDSDKCKDARGTYNVCAIYSFEIKNEGSSETKDITGSILTTTLKSDCTPDESENCIPEKQFENLSYVVYDVTDGGNTKISTETLKFAKTGGTTQLFANGTDNSVSVTSGSTRKFEVLVWLNELSDNVSLDDGSGDQSFEQGLTYTGTVSVTVKDESDQKITGQ